MRTAREERSGGRPSIPPFVGGDVGVRVQLAPEVLEWCGDGLLRTDIEVVDGAAPLTAVDRGISQREEAHVQALFLFGRGEDALDEGVRAIVAVVVDPVDENRAVRDLLVRHCGISW